jgi:hypothetical protein
MAGRGKNTQQRLLQFQGQLRKILPLVERLLEAGEIQEPGSAYASSRKEEAGTPAHGEYRVEHYGPRFWALYKGDRLRAVTVYRRGAEELKKEFERLEAEIVRLQQIVREREEGHAAPREGSGAVERLQAEWESGHARGR